MDELVASYIQSIPDEGYLVRTMETVQVSSLDVAQPRRVADAMIWPNHAVNIRSYEPMREQTALFYKLADLGSEPTDQDILAFSNQYGWLGVVEPSMMLQSNNDGSRAKQIVSAEFLDSWRHCYRTFTTAMDLWTAIKNGDESYLANVITWHHHHESVSYSDRGNKSVLIASINSNRDLMQSFYKGELLRPAKVVLTRSINEQLSELCRPALLFSDSSYEKSHLYFECNNLLGVIWLQFAKAVEQNGDYRRCVECEQPFIPNRNERGKRKKFCTDACKSRHYRRNRQP